MLHVTYYFPLGMNASRKCVARAVDGTNFASAIKRMFPRHPGGIVPTIAAKETPPCNPHLNVETNLETLAKLVLENTPTLRGSKTSLQH